MFLIKHRESPQSAHKEESLFTRFFKENPNKKSVDILKENINVFHNFCPSCLIIRNTCCQKKKKHFLSGDIELNPGPSKIFVLLTYGEDSCAHQAPIFVNMNE